MATRELETVSSRLTERQWLVVIFATALILRVGAILLLQTYQNPREFEDLFIARRVVAGDGFVWAGENATHKYGTVLPTVYMPPGYVYLEAALMWVLGENTLFYLILEFLQSLLGAIMALLVYQIGKEAFGSTVGLVSGLIVAVYPAFIFTSTQLVPLNVYWVLNLLVLIGLLRFRRTRDLWHILKAGFWMGLTILFRPDTMAYLFLMAVWVWLNSWPRLRMRAARAAFAFLAVAVLIVAPWTARNHLVFGKFIPVSYLQGYNLWRGNNEDTPGTGRTLSGEYFQPRQDLYDTVARLPVTRDYEIKIDDVYMQRTLQYIRENPGRIARLAMAKFFWYWIGDFTDPKARHPLYFLPWFVILPFFLIGLWQTRRKPFFFSLFYLYFGVSTAVGMVFFVLPRYRMFIEPLVIMVAVYGALSLSGQCQGVAEVRA